MLEKKKCLQCHQKGKPHIVINKTDYICADCMKKQREAMLADPNHPAWQYYNLISQILGTKGKTDD